MEVDLIVEEVRVIRDEFAQRYNYDVDAIVLALQEATIQRGVQVISFPPRLVEPDVPRKAR